MAKVQAEAAATTQATEDKEMQALREVRLAVRELRRGYVTLIDLCSWNVEHGQVHGGRAEPRVPTGARAGLPRARHGRCAPDRMVLALLHPFTMIKLAWLLLLLTGDGSNIESLLGSLKQEEQQDADDVNLGVAKTLQVMPLLCPSCHQVSSVD